MVTDVAVSDDVVIIASPMPICMNGHTYIIVMYTIIESPSPSTVTITGIACSLGMC